LVLSPFKNLREFFAAIFYAASAQTCIQPWPGEDSGRLGDDLDGTRPIAAD
jgi:hypothetical protein